MESTGEVEREEEERRREREQRRIIDCIENV